MGKTIPMSGKSKAMDLLKSALADRQAKAQKTVAEAGKSWVKRSVLEEQRKQEYFEEKQREEEKWQADEEARFAKLNEHLTKKTQEGEEEKAIPSHILDDALLGDDDAEPPVGISEVIDRLRELMEPITIFGETDMQRYKRLRSLEKEAHEGKKNPDVLMLEGLNMTQKQSMLEQDQGEQEAHEEEEEDSASGSDEEGGENKEKHKDKEAGGGGGGGGEEVADDKSDSEDEGEGPPKHLNDDKSDSEDEGETIAANQRSKMMQAAAKQREDQAKAAEGGAAEGGEQGKHPDPATLDVPEVDLPMMDKCDTIRQWIRKAQKAWEKELADKPDDEKKTQRCKNEVAAHRQVRRDVRPLQKRLRLYVINEALLDKIHVIVDCAANLRYRDASEAYLDLSIGKAAWPVGIGCGGSMLMEDAIGLHDRFNRMENVKDNAVTLNDDVTRKFVQALKRLMNVAQKYWPPDDPSNRC